MSKRYRKGQFPFYDDRYYRHIENSNILNPDTQSPSSVHWVDFTRVDALKAERLLLAGNEDGSYLRERTWMRATIPSLQDKIKAIEERFADHQQTQINAGKPKPEAWPKELLEERLDLEARLDVAERELAEIDRRLTTAKENSPVKEQDDAQVLRNGPRGSGQLRGGILWQVDGQMVKVSPGGELYIADERSPYNGLKTAAYHELVVMPYLKTQSQTYRLREKHRVLKRKLEGNGHAKDFPECWAQMEKELMAKFTELRTLQENGISYKGRRRVPKPPENKEFYVQQKK